MCNGAGGGGHHGGGSGTISATMVEMSVLFITLPRHIMKQPYFMYFTFWLSQGGGQLFQWVPGYNCLTMVTGSRKPVIGHGIGGKHIPIMARLAKARRWSKR